MIFGIPMGDNNDRAKAIHQLFRRAYSDLEVSPTDTQYSLVIIVLLIFLN